MTKEELMRKAIELSKENVENGGGPFGAVIATKEGVERGKYETGNSAFFQN